MSNVDHAEIAKFEALAHRWWDRHSEFKPLHDINPLRVNWIDQRTPLAGKRVLDVGCGGGILSEAMAQRGATVTGIDMGEAPLAVARLHQLESGVNVDYRQITAEALRSDIPDFRPGDQVKVHVRVIEGNRSRIQVFAGVVIARNGSGIAEAFTVRKVSFGVGVERTFPVHSPKIDHIEISRRGDVNRAKLYYLRDKVGKAAKIKEKSYR